MASETPLVRCAHDYEDHSQRFVVETRKFTQQYANVYSCRLQIMRPMLTQVVKKKWGSGIPIKKIHELNISERAIIVGTTFKRMKLKPSILKEISEDNHLALQPIRDKFFDESDFVVLEDELQHIRLSGNVQPRLLVTGDDDFLLIVNVGIIAAVLGVEDEKGEFVMEDMCFTDVPAPMPKAPQNDEEMYVALISGLGFGNPADNRFPLELASDFLVGYIGSENDVQSVVKIVRVIIAGNSVSQFTQDKDVMKKAKYLTRKTTAGTVDAVKALDDFFARLCESINIDVMPGKYDPSNFMMPQRPLHKCIFPNASKYSSFRCVSNPYEASIQNVRFLGSSGQTVHDIQQYSNMEDPLEIMENTLRWGHLAPTAPDTLNCYPFHDDDPFVVKNCPDVYFVGNQSKYATRIHEGGNGQRIRMVSVPSFSDSRTLVLVNLKNLECHPVTFDDSMELSE